MERLHPLFTMRTSLSFLLLILFQTSTVAVAERICSAPVSVQFPENNSVGQLITSITVKSGVTLTFSPTSDNPNPFRLEGNQLLAAKVFDYESAESPVASIICTETATGLKEKLTIVVILINLNDNPPVFDKNPYRISVYEMSPVGTSVGHFAATDLDKPNQLYYRLTSEANEFELRSPTDPDLLVKTPLDYDKVKNVRLVLTAQDTPLTPTEGGDSFTATTTILVNILDSDNRPPWFQPCTMHDVGGAMICQSTGYTGRVVLNEQETGVLPLKPGPLYAIDGDSGINEEITYSFLSGNNENLFEINGNTGNISMLKPAHKLDSIILTVLAAQRRNSHQFATTTVTISVQEKSNNPPQFQRPRYEGIITAVGSMAMDLEDKDKPLQILATDDDYTTTGGINPYVTYSIIGSSDFSIIDGRLFMTKHLPEDILSLQVVANDTSNDESATAQLMVEVKTGLTTTGLPLSTTDIMTTTATAESTTDSKTTEDIASTTSSVSTTNPSMTSEVILPSGAYGWVEMAALGATLGALLLICLVVIGVLAHRLRRDKADWRKIYETNMFRSSLGQGAGGPKEGIQYTNEAFQNDEDDQSMGSGGPEGGSRMAGREPRKAMEDHMRTEAIMKSSAPLHTLLPSDNTSQASSDKSDSDQEVKPILTKERRIEEGYKSVWFKEDIDPNAKEEVVIIPDSREDDSEEEDAEQSSSRREEGEYEDPPVKSRKVVFGDADLDSGLGVKMGDSAEDSDGDQELTSDL
ncbi:cadherin-related family member 5 isoform X2 [Trachinotus anak]|uniref:cadherin-related family member 5 isoform X2 n=1 Tax=Trachinotus anak TaxID=443729 RepID=UPI0039F21BF9